MTIYILEKGEVMRSYLLSKESETVSYKNFMQQLNAYTNLSEVKESYAPSVLASLSYTLKKAYKNLIL